MVVDFCDGAGSTTSLLRAENLEREVAEFLRSITPNTSALSVFAGFVVFMGRFNAMANYLLHSRVCLFTILKVLDTYSH